MLLGIYINVVRMLIYNNYLFWEHKNRPNSQVANITPSWPMVLSWCYFKTILGKY
jgi:hypothetical protein